MAGLDPVIDEFRNRLQGGADAPGGILAQHQVLAVQACEFLLVPPLDHRLNGRGHRGLDGVDQRHQRVVPAARQQDHEALQTRVEALADTAGQTIAAVSGMVVEQTAARETTRRMIGEVANAAIAALTAGQGRLTHDLQELQQWTQAAVDDGPPAARPPVPAAAPAAGLRLSAAQAAIHGAELRYEAGPDRDSLGYWTRADDWAQWQLEVPQPGRFQVRAEIAALAAGRFEVAVGDQVLEGHAPTTADYGRFETVELGTVELPVPGPTHLAVRPIPEGWQPMNLKALDLVPVTSSSA